MDSTIIAAIIAGVFAIVVAVETFLLTKLSNKEKPYINRYRREILKGEWEGFAHQEATSQFPPLDYHIISRITATTRGIQSEVEMQVQNRTPPTTERLEVTGTLAYDRFLKLEYIVRDKPEAIQFGFLLLELNPNGRLIEGRFLSFSPAAQALVQGTVELHKIR